MTTNQDSDDESGAAARSSLNWSKRSNPVPLKRVISPLDQWLIRRRFRQMGLPVQASGSLGGVFGRTSADSRTRPFIWVLQKNSSVPKRIRAVCVTTEQQRSLSKQSELLENRDLYCWRGFPLGGAKRRPNPQVPLEEVHAVVELREATESVSIASKVRVTEVYVDRRAAEDACARLSRQHPQLAWAVITYPVGRMLF